MTADAETWLARYAEALGVAPPSEEEVEHLLALAGIAAHASERIAAPVSCWVAARSTKTAQESLTTAKEVAEALGDGE